MYILNLIFIISLGWSLVSSENTNASSIYIFNYHSKVDNRTNLTNAITQNVGLNFGNITNQSASNENKSTTLQPIFNEMVFNLSEPLSIKRMEEESFRPDFISELPREKTELSIKKDKKRDLPTSESAIILINLVNNSRMLNSQKRSQLTDTRQQPDSQVSYKPTTDNQKPTNQNTKSNDERSTNSTIGDVDMLKFEDELDVQPHSFITASRMNVNITKSPVTLEKAETRQVAKGTTVTSKPEGEENMDKKLKKKHLQILQFKKKFKNNPDKFKTIKIRAPRLYLGNGTSQVLGEKQVRRHKIGYASFVRTRNVNLTDYHLDDGLFIKKRIQNRDHLDSSGSENRIRLIMIHSYKKPANERFAKRVMIKNQHRSPVNEANQLIGAAGQTHPIFVKLNANRRLANNPGAEERVRSLAQSQITNNNAQINSNSGQLNSGDQAMYSANYQSSSNRFIPKLLLPRFTRPKMYSLDGFIPRPNVQKFTTTTSSSLNVNNRLTQFQRNKLGRKLNDKLSDKPTHEELSKRRKYKSKTSNDLEDDDLNTSGSATRKRQVLFMKRKGFGFEEETNSVKAKETSQEKKKNSYRKGLKAIDFQFPKANYPKELLESLNIRPEAPKFEYPNARKDFIKDAKNFPSYNEIPKTTFQCPENLSSGVFADFETRCQAWHMCEKGTKHSFLCANGTVFNEKVGVCDHWYNVDCNSVKLKKLF